MNCLKCNSKNAGSVGYCQKCGAKLDFTADEIAGSLVASARAETARNTEFYVRRTLTLAAVVFLMAVTLWVLTLGEPRDPFAIPALSRGAEHVKVDFKLEPELPKLSIPLEIRKR
jgi:hypothetical protein